MHKYFFDKTTMYGFLFTAFTAFCFAIFGQIPSALGTLTASCWMFLNLWFLYKLLESGAPNHLQKHPGRMLLLAVLKFPVIYLAGYFILKSKYFPLVSLLAGLGLFFAAMAVSWVLIKAENNQRKKESANILQTSSIVNLLIFGFIFMMAFCGPQSDVLALDSHEAHTTQSAGDVHGGHDSHDAKEHDSHGQPHTINWVLLLAKACEPSAFSQFLVTWEKSIFTGLIVIILSVLSISVSKNIRRVPGRFQGFMEILISGLDSLVQGVIGHRGRAYTPFLGTLFIYILASNLLGLVPLQNSVLAYLTSVVPITICVFFYVQWVGISKNGFGGYLLHLCGSPKDAFGWGMAPFMFPLHVLGEFIKPLSLTFRLYGNIMSGHLLLAVFLGMGVSMLKNLNIPAGIPIHFPFLFLEILVGVIQAFVFTLLSTIYIAMMLPHEHEHEHAEHGAEAVKHE